MSLLDHLRRLHDYEEWATRLAATSLRTAAAASRAGTADGTASPFKRAVEIFGHIQSARHLWLSTLGAVAERPFVMFPQSTIDEIEADARGLDRLYREYLATLTEADLSHTVRRVRANGDIVYYRRGDILTHVVNHGSYHRGQIAVFVKQCGGVPEQTDFVRWTREAGGAPMEPAVRG